MTTTKYPKKIFKIGALQNNILTNADENARFLEPRINALKSCQYGSPAFYSTLEDIFIEFVDVYEFDKTTAVLPEPFGSFRSEDHKKEWMENHLLAIEFDYHLGCILYNYHEWLDSEGHLPDIILVCSCNLFEKKLPCKCGNESDSAQEVIRCVRTSR